MPKSIYDLKDFSGGLNTRIDKRDIPDTDFANSLGFSFDTPGIIKMLDKAKRHRVLLVLQSLHLEMQIIN